MLPAQLQQATAGSPLIAGAVAFGIGALIAAVLPETEPERRAVQAVQAPAWTRRPTRSRTWGNRRSRPRRAVQEAAQELKDSATDHAHRSPTKPRTRGKQLKDDAQESRQQ